MVRSQETKKVLKFIQAGNADFIYKNELEKACFQHDMVYDKQKNLAKRTQSDKFLRGKALQVIKKLQVIQSMVVMKED